MMADIDFVASFDGLSVDVLSKVFGFLPLKDIMCGRCINKKTREVVKKTTVPTTDVFCLKSVKKYSAMGVMTTELPNLQQIMIGGLEYGHKWSVGEDPDEEWAAQTADRTTHDIGIISAFRKLCILGISNAGLNGRYPALFNFPLLQKFSIGCSLMKWDLEMLAGLPSLKELNCEDNQNLTGNINSLRLLKDTLEKVTLQDCPRVEGNFMDLADFPHLKRCWLRKNAVKGDIRDIGENDFLLLEVLTLPKGVYGGSGYEFQSITDATDLVKSLYLLNKRRSTLSMLDYWFGQLSEDSPEWYDSGNYRYPPPFQVCFVEAGSRIGYRWESFGADRPCEMNWFDPEPDRESSDYAKYVEELQKLNRECKVDMYRGFHQPPTQEEHNRLVYDEYCGYSEDELFDYGSDEDEEW